MPKGMRRTVIMSHGKNHDAKGVRGVHRQGTVPDAKVLAAIPESIGAIGNLPEQANRGDQAATAERPPNSIRGGKSRIVYDEGVPVMPGGNREGLATMRPDLESQVPADVSTHEDTAAADEEAHEEVSETQEAPSETPLAPEATTSPEEAHPPTEGEEAVRNEESESPPLPTSKRRLIRSRVAELRAWCAALDIIPEEYVEEGEEVTGNLMRVLVGDKLNIDHGIVLDEE